MTPQLQRLISEAERAHSYLCHIIAYYDRQALGEAARAVKAALAQQTQRAEAAEKERDDQGRAAQHCFKKMSDALQRADQAEQRAKRMEEALRVVHDWRGLCDANANETFERIAKDFYRETGLMRPGKDQPAVLSGPEQEERYLAWNNWCTAKNKAVDDLIKQALTAPPTAKGEG